MSRSLMLLAGLLVGSLVWAYLLTNPIGGGASKSTVSVWRVKPRDVASLTYRKGDTKITLEPSWREGRDAPYIWVRSQSRPRGRVGPNKPPQPAKIRTQAFKANASAEKILQQFSNLEAKRSVGELSQIEGEAFGLPSERHTLELQLRGERSPLFLELGNATYGNLMRYAAVKGQDRLYLFYETSFTRLGRARSVLFDRELFPVSPSQAKRLQIRQGAKTRDIWKLEGLRNINSWANAPEDAEGSAELAQFVTALKNLKVPNVLPRPNACKSGKGPKRRTFGSLRA